MGSFFSFTCNTPGDDVLVAASPSPQCHSYADSFDVQVLSFKSDHKGNRIGFSDLALRLFGGQQIVIKHCSVHRAGSVWVTFPAERIGPGKDGYRNLVHFRDAGDQMQFTAAVAVALAPFINKAEAQ